MTGRVPALLVAASLAVLLGGCSAHEPPPSYTDEELETYFEQRLDAAWLNTGLDGQVQRPLLPGKTVDRFDTDNFFEMSNCMLESGMSTGWATDEANGGPTFSDDQGAELTAEAKLAAYTCFATFPVSDNFRNIILTAEQKSYLYDYYARWIVPCLTSNGFVLSDRYVPDRESFLGAFGDWNPYYAIVSGPGLSESEGMSGEQALALVEQCGSEFADLDVEVPDRFGLGG